VTGAYVLSYEVERADLLALNTWFDRRSGGRSLRAVVLLALGGVALAVWTIRGDVLYLVGGGLLLTLGVLLTPPGRALVLRVLLRVRTRPWSARLGLDPVGLTLASEARSRVGWDSVLEVAEDRGNLYLRFSDTQIWPVPKRAFGDRRDEIVAAVHAWWEAGRSRPRMPVGSLPAPQATDADDDPFRAPRRPSAEA
jgi:hypothetical protein